jgi:aspartyl protease family protein
MNLKIKILSQLLLLTVLVNGQISFTVNIDANSKAVALLFNQKKFDAALSLVNKIIIDKPAEGINYFNRAVIHYYKNPKPMNTTTYIGISHGKKVFLSSYDTSVVSDCKRAQEAGYRNSEIFYLVFLQYYNYEPNSGPGAKRGILNDAYGHQSVGYDDQKELLDSAIKIKWDEKYFSAKFELYVGNKILTTYFDLSKENMPTIRSDCDRMASIAKDKKRKFLAYYYLAQISKYYSDTIKAINYLSIAIDINPINVKLTKGRKFDAAYDNLFAERGKLREGIKDFEGAISDFNIHLLRWDDAEIYDERAWCYWIMGNNTNALRDINKTITLYERDRKELLTSFDPFDKYKFEYQQTGWGSAYFLRGLINATLMKDKEALKDYNKAIEYGNKEAISAKNELLQVTDIFTNDPETTQTVNNDNSISMVKKNGVYEIPITINGSLKINFIFDAGASDVSISPDVALTLIRTGTVSDKDFIGTETYKFADGSTAKSKIFILKELQIGSRKVTNVRTSISNSLDAPLLLGQSALNKFGKITIDYKNGIIRFED